MTTEVTCVSGQGCTYGPLAIQQMYDAGYLGHNTSTIYYECISIDQVECWRCQHHVEAAAALIPSRCFSLL